MAIASTTHMQERMRQVIALSVKRVGALLPAFNWACALHTGTYEAEVEDQGRRAMKSFECWMLTTLGGETMPVTAEVLLALDNHETPCWWMGAHPVVLERTAMFIEDEPLKMLFVTHLEGPDTTKLGRCNLDYRTLIRPHDFNQSIILTTVVRPSGLPR